MEELTRRDMLIKTGIFGTSSALGIGMATGAGADKNQPNSSGNRKLRIIVTGGHPGDPEYGCGGTIARYADLGHDVVLLYLNKGEWTDKPGYDPAPVRVAEAKKACEILGGRPVFAGQIDGQAIVDKAHYDEFRKILEAERPDVIFTHWPIDHHADHRAMSNLVYDAWHRMGKQAALYYYEVSNGEDTLQFSPTHYVDISDVIERKREACYAHASQTPDQFYGLQETVTKFRGIESGTAQAEAYIRHIQSPDFGLPMVS